MSQCQLYHTLSYTSSPGWGVFRGGVLFAGLAAGLSAGVSTQFIQCGQDPSAVEASTCNNPNPPRKLLTRIMSSSSASSSVTCGRPAGFSDQQRRMRDAMRGGVSEGSGGRSLLMATATMICKHEQHP